MYKIFLKDLASKHEYDSLIQNFLEPDRYEINPEYDKNIMYTFGDDEIFLKGDSKNQIKQDIYSKLSKLTGIFPEWGIHTGVRPVKLTGELFEKFNFNEDSVRNELSRFYMISDEKVDLLCRIFHLQKEVLKESEKHRVSLYLGIPFCPTRCLYCSFTSNQVEEEKIHQYLGALHNEIKYTGTKMKEYGIKPESVYIGGGTPTSLSAKALDKLLNLIVNTYDLSEVKEFTVEAGRPDTINIDKLKIMDEYGVSRISINPQTMKDETLKLIGRSHSVAEVYRAFEMTKKFNFLSVNADIIAGLPEESVFDFENTLRKMIEILQPNNITVHTLAIKRASKLIDIDSNFHYKQAKVVKEMLDIGKGMLSSAGYRPYYLYRQKHMAGGLENVGYAQKGTEGIYNIRIMDEHQSIIALGAGGISKAYYPEENRLERIPNVSNYEIYIDRLQEMLDRKEKGLFRRECYE